jgi:hypothetical protein
LPIGKNGFRRLFRGGLPLSKQPKNALSLLATLLFGAVVAFTGCEAEKGPGERAGEAVDKGVQNVKDAVTNPGPGEKVGREVDKATKP